MRLITITLQLTTEEITAVLSLLDNMDKNHSKASTSPQVHLPVNTTAQPKQGPVTHSIGPKTGIKLPGFSRTPSQIAEFEEKERNRLAELDEEAEEKEQRNQERLAKKAIKDEEEAAKLEEARLAQLEVDAIRTPTILVVPSTVKKPWSL